MSTSGRKTSKTAPEQLDDGGTQNAELTGGLTGPDAAPSANGEPSSEGGAPALAGSETPGDGSNDPVQSGTADDPVTDQQADTGAADLAVPVVSELGPARPLNPGEVEVFPLRAYHDEGELRRRRGKGYMVSKRHADALVLRGLASLQGPEE